MAEGKKRRPRRSFTEEFKAEVVKKVLSSGKTAGQVARELDLTETAVRAWVRQAQIDKGKGPPGALTSAEKEELARLRKENRELREDREILKKPRPSSRSSTSEVRVHRRGEGLPPHHEALHRSRGLARGLLRVVREAGVGARRRGRAAHDPHPRGARTKPPNLR